MHIHDEISRITDMDGISRVDLQGVTFADFPVVTREMAFAGVETALGEDLGSRLPGDSVERAMDSDEFSSYIIARVVIKDKKMGFTNQQSVPFNNKKEMDQWLSARKKDGSLMQVAGVERRKGVLRPSATYPRGSANPL